MLSTKSQRVHMKSYINVLILNLDCADEEAAGERSDRERSSTPSVDTEAGHPKGVRSVARKHSSSSQATRDR